MSTYSLATKYAGLQTAGFRVDTSNLLGLNFQSYLSAIRGKALSKPDEYFLMRAEVLEGVRAQIIRELYDTLFAVMSRGTMTNGDRFGANKDSQFGTKAFIPDYPQDKINDFCVEVVTHLSNDLNRCIDIILPDDFEKLAASKLQLKGRGNTISIDP